MASKYRFYATYGVTETEVFPLNYSGTSLVYDKSNDGVYYRRKLNGKLTFSNRPKDGVFDYSYFENIEDTDRCSEFLFRITRLCNGTYVNHWNGTFSTTEGDWDRDKCTFMVEPKLSDCLLSNIQLNILDIEDKYTITANTVLSGSGVRNYPNAMKFEDVLHFLATETCGNVNGIVSDFFQINPVNVSSINYVTGTTNYLAKMYINSLSDVQEPVPSNAATAEKIGWIDITNDLRILFNVYWFLDENNNIRIEHLKWFDGAAGLDITTNYYQAFTKSTNKYKYDMAGFPKYETFSMLDSDQGCRITYEGCGNINKSENEVSFSVTKISTDYFKRIYTPGLVNGNQKGLFLWCVDAGPVMRGNYQNEELVLARLVLKYHRYNRPQLNATLEYFRSLDSDTGFTNSLCEFTDKNYGDLFIYSEKPNKKRVSISIPLCCDTEFNPEDYLLTEYGKGFIDSASLNNGNDMIQLSLAYKINEDLTDITPSAFIGNGLQVWLKADAGVTTSGGQVTVWADQSGNGNDATDSLYSSGPNVSGGALRFFSGQQLTTAALALFPAKRGTIIIVQKYLTSSITDQSLISTVGGSGNVWDISFKANSGGAFYYSFTESRYFPTPLPAKNPGFYGEDLKEIFCFNRNANDSAYIHRNAKGGDSFIYNPYVVAGTEKNPWALPNTQPDTNILIIGDNLTVSGGATIDVYEVIVFDREITDIERQQIEMYLAKKWDINLYTL